VQDEEFWAAQFDERLPRGPRGRMLPSPGSDGLLNLGAIGFGLWTSSSLGDVSPTWNLLASTIWAGGAFAVVWLSWQGVRRLIARLHR